MIVNYIGSIDNRYEVSEYVLSTGTKLVLSKDEIEEFVFNSRILEMLKDYEDDEEYNDIDTYNEPLEIKEPNVRFD